MHYAQIHIARLVVFFLEVLLYNLAQGSIASFVPLYNVTDPLVDYYEVVVFIEDLKVGGVGFDGFLVFWIFGIHFRVDLNLEVIFMIEFNLIIKTSNFLFDKKSKSLEIRS